MGKVSQEDGAPAHTARLTQSRRRGLPPIIVHSSSVRMNGPKFTGLKPLDFHVWGAMLEVPATSDNYF